MLTLYRDWVSFEVLKILASSIENSDVLNWGMLCIGVFLKTISLNDSTRNLTGETLLYSLIYSHLGKKRVNGKSNISVT